MYIGAHQVTLDTAPCALGYTYKYIYCTAIGSTANDLASRYSTNVGTWYLVPCIHRRKGRTERIEGEHQTVFLSAASTPSISSILNVREPGWSIGLGCILPAYMYP